MHRSDVRSLADCFWRPSPLSSSSPLCSASCTDGARRQRSEIRQAYPVDGQHPQRIDTMPADDTRDSQSDSRNLSSSTRRKRRSWRPAALIATAIAVGGAIFARFVDRVDAEEKLARTTSEAVVPSVAV